LKAAHAEAVLAAETSTREAAMVQDSANLHIKDAEDRATLAEGEALEPVSQAEVENSTVLSSARADAEGLEQKIIHFEDELMEGALREF
jgi:hypothetical protein